MPPTTMSHREVGAAVVALGAALVGVRLLLRRRLVAAAHADTARVRHLVFFAFKEGAPVSAFVRAFDVLAAEMSISHYERGVNNSAEGLTKGLTHCFALTFPSARARDAYLFDPLHTAFVEAWVKPHVLADVCVFDYQVDAAPAAKDDPVVAPATRAPGDHQSTSVLPLSHGRDHRTTAKVRA